MKYNICYAKYIYNMHESGVRIGCPIGEIVIVLTGVKELYSASSENHRSVTIIEVICTDGRLPLPPLIICLGEKIIDNWVYNNLTGTEVIAISPTGYKNENIALSWLDHFIKHIGAGLEKP
ncbi:hypothetical protein L873DRAFT_1898661 [Choiromyces venosus 120613-1]|uniref:DDE-1 domain-containing protein n=1 Tax=Choiromyces venosus 120613-1 TaxID=1336337 RepID=A0A3N4KHU4_9PEZI|nr:hypothetical protein L873DRAFT_1898661 [Choiromyces venosus 120613-1]